MALEPVWKDRELLHKLLSEYLAGTLDVRRFCDNFETAFNFDVHRSSLSLTEKAAFAKLFDVVVYFSPFPEERASVPNYKNEEEIWQAAKDAAASLAS
jgi:hypothetical protein